MERAKKLWEDLGLPKLRPRAPWRGYSLGDWLPQWDEAAKRAVEGRYIENGKISEAQRKKGVKPETKFRPEQNRGQIPVFRGPDAGRIPISGGGRFRAPVTDPLLIVPTQGGYRGIGGDRAAALSARCEYSTAMRWKA